MNYGLNMLIVLDCFQFVRIVFGHVFFGDLLYRRPRPEYPLTEDAPRLPVDAS